MRVELEDFPDAVGDGGVDTIAQRTSVILDENNVVGVEPGYSVQLLHLQPDYDALLLLAFDGNLDSVA